MGAYYTSPAEQAEQDRLSDLQARVDAENLAYNRQYALEKRLTELEERLMVLERQLQSKPRRKK